jgi:hypothetical protein
VGSPEIIAWLLLELDWHLAFLNIKIYNKFRAESTDSDLLTGRQFSDLPNLEKVPRTRCSHDYGEGGPPLWIAMLPLGFLIFTRLANTLFQSRVAVTRIRIASVTTEPIATDNPLIPLIKNYRRKEPERTAGPR